MRVGIVVVGVVLLVIGAVFAFVPLVPQSSQTLSEFTPYEANITGFSITGSLPATLTWSASASVQLLAVTCTAMNSQGNCTGSTSWANQTGTSGSESLTLTPGGAVLVAFAPSASSPSTTTVTFHLTIAEGTIGLILIVVGVLVLIVGVILKKKGPKTAPTPAAEPVTEPTAPPTQP